MKKSKMSAVTLRGILATMIVLLIILSGVGFYFAQSWLSTQAIAVSHKVADSTSSGTSVPSLQKLKTELASEQDIITKTNALMTPASTYQTQAVQDLITYANVTGITISNYSFPATAASGATPTTPATTTAATANAGPSTQVTATLTSPLPYTNLLKFMYDIETNLPKMQITSIDLTRVDGNSNSVGVSQLTIAVYTK